MCGEGGNLSTRDLRFIYAGRVGCEFMHPVQPTDAPSSRRSSRSHFYTPGFPRFWTNIEHLKTMKDFFCHFICMCVYICVVLACAIYIINVFNLFYTCFLKWAEWTMWSKREFVMNLPHVVYLRYILCFAIYYVSPSNEGRHIALVWIFLPLPLLLLLLSEACPDHNFFVFPDRSIIFGMWVHDHQAVCCIL